MMMHSILLLGQSNMGGRGDPAEVEPIENEDGSIQVFRNGRWRKMYTPVNPDRVASGVNLAESFADRYRAEHPEVDRVGLIGCADGGSHLSQWAKGMMLYDYAVACAKLAQRTSNIVAILWHQGESDCTDERLPLYEKRFLQFKRDLQHDLGLEDIPFIVGGLGDYLALRVKKDGTIPSSSYLYPRMNEVLQKIAAEQPLMGFVPATGLVDKGDRLHFDSKSLREFGLRYYDVFRTLEDRSRVWQDKPTPEEIEGAAESDIAEL